MLAQPVAIGQYVAVDTA